MKILRVFAWLYPTYAQMNVAAAVVGSAVVGGAMSSMATGDAADAQSASAAQADATQRYQYDTTRADNAPFRETGLSANNRLAYLMGIGGTPTNNTNAPGAMTFEQAMQKTAENYFNTDPLGTGGTLAESIASGRTRQADANNTAQAIMDAHNKALNLDYSQNYESDPNYGSLLRNYGQSDAENDYIYQTQKQFGLDEGTKGLNRIAAASGSMLSGAAAKALTRFGNDYAGTKLGESYNRFENNKTGTYNKLAGISGAGQIATNQVSAAGQNMANNISSNQIGLGNARGASAIAQGNALSGGISSAINSYQQNQLMNSFNRPQQASFGSGGMGGFGDSYSTSYGE